MKSISICLAFTVCVALASCESTQDGTTSTDNADTSVLVSDPDNTLNANPINDTVVSDTVQHMEP